VEAKERMTQLNLKLNLTDTAFIQGAGCVRGTVSLGPCTCFWLKGLGQGL